MHGHKKTQKQNKHLREWAPNGSFSDVAPRRAAVAREGAPLSPFAPGAIGRR
jgi:hypothetical protein